MKRKNNDPRYSADAFDRKQEWEKALRDYRTPLPKGYTKANLLAYCVVMASYGKNGLGCYANAETIAQNLGWSKRQIATKYKKLALELGWFVWTGKYHENKPILDIAILTPGTMPSARAIKPATVQKVAPKATRDDSDPWANTPVVHTSGDTTDAPDWIKPTMPPDDAEKLPKALAPETNGYDNDDYGYTVPVTLKTVEAKEQIAVPRRMADTLDIFD